MELQKAGVWKRIAAWLLDFMLICVLAVGIAFVFSTVFKYDAHLDTVNAAYEKYETEYGVKFNVTPEEYAQFSQEDIARYNEAYAALTADVEAMTAYNMAINLILITVTLSLLITYLALEVLIPLLLKNGQTVGKKAFNLGVMRIDGVRLTNIQLFVRAVLGKYTLETMIPVYIIILILFGSGGYLGLIVLLALAAVQICFLFGSKNCELIHDRMAGTVAVDLSSQKIFETTDDLIEYKQKLQAERAAKQDY